MSDALSTPPVNVTDFKIGLGKALLNANLAILHGSNIPDWAVDRASDQANIAAAETWHAHHANELAGLAGVLKRALPYLPGDTDGALISLMSDYQADMYGAWTFMMSATPRYVRDAVMMANKAAPDQFKKNLEVIVAFCEGN